MSLMCEYREVKTSLFYLEKKEGIMKKLEKKQLVVVAFTFALLLLIGGTYAYFSINASNNHTGTKVTGKANNLGNPTMQIKTSKLYLNLDANLMSQANAEKTYYANEDESGLALITNPNYVLAMASLPEGDEPLDCTYNYKVTATVTTPITDNSDSDVKVIVGDKTMTLKELTTAGTDGIIVSGDIKNLTKGQSVSISLTSSVTNTSSTQDKLVGNSYTINIEPYNEGDTKAFSCKLSYQIDTAKTLAQNLIDSDWLWQSGLEGDGYRYTGTGITCSYDDGKYVIAADNQQTTPNCPKRYNYTRTTISSGATNNYTYSTTCPSDTSTYTYSCTELDSEIRSKTIPNNFICFGTTSKSECTANQDKYIYRIIGVFSDSNGDNHVKLIKYKQLGRYKWNSDKTTDVSWENSDMYKGLNGEYFLTNTTYDYMQNTTWSNIIENWTWSAVNTKTNEDLKNNTSYYRSSPTGIYLSEMHKTSTGTLCANYSTGGAVNCNVGEWTTPTGRIGLMYVSDYALSLGSSALALTRPDLNMRLLKTGWLHQSNNDTAKYNYEWTLAREGTRGNGTFDAWDVTNDGGVGSYSVVSDMFGVRPVFYLISDVKITDSGDGSLDNPFIIE